MSNPPQHFISLNSCTVWKSLINLRLSPHMTLGLEKAQSIPLNWKLVEPAVFILKQDNNRDRRQSYINSGYINVIHYNELNTLTLLPEGETCETKHRRGNGRGSRRTVTDALPASEMKSFALMLILMKRISEVLKFRFKRTPCESLATGGNQSSESQFSHRRSSYPPIC